MSAWTYVNGVLTIKATDSMSQADLQYQVYKTLEHLPRITGSESNLKPYIIKKHGTNSSCNRDEYGQFSNLGNGYDEHSFDVQDEYLIVLNGGLRDRVLKETYNEVVKWLIRLAKRIWVKDVLIEVSDGCNKIMINPNDDLIGCLQEYPYIRMTSKYKKNDKYWFGNCAGNIYLDRWKSYSL